MTSTLIQPEIQSELNPERSGDAERKSMNVWPETGIAIALLAFMIVFFFSVFLG
jgi:hypothetical protein